ncbi:pyrimidine utilization regulatory protein R [Raoultella planticola]|nr:pyrimidine utilization regulatory protein R [Raoultella planticola]
MPVRGFAHTSLNAIAKEAGVTPAMLHYYFSSREALVDQLLEERFMPLRSEIGQIFIEHPEDPVTAFTLLIEALGTLAEKHNWFAPLWMQEVIGEMPILRQHMHARFGDDKYHRMLATVKRWQEEGKLNPALSPELLFTTLISPGLVPFSRLRTDHTLSLRLPTDHCQPRADADPPGNCRLSPRAIGCPPELTALSTGSGAPSRRAEKSGSDICS